MLLFVLSLCPFDISVGVGAFVIGLDQISFFCHDIHTPPPVPYFVLYTFVFSFELQVKAYFTFVTCWLVGCIEDLRRFSDISAISRLGSRR